MKKQIIITSAILAIIITSCKKEDDKCTAGAGGNLQVVVFPKHHNKEVRPYKAMVKFNTKDSPGTSASNYDLVLNADTTENHIELGALKCGDYFIYMTGYDTSAVAGVKGGIPYTISEDLTGELNIDIPVTE